MDVPVSTCVKRKRKRNKASIQAQDPAKRHASAVPKQKERELRTKPRRTASITFSLKSRLNKLYQAPLQDQLQKEVQKCAHLRTDTMIVFNNFLQDMPESDMDGLHQGSEKADAQHISDILGVLLYAASEPEAARPWQTQRASRIHKKHEDQLRDHVRRHFETPGVVAETVASQLREALLTDLQVAVIEHMSRAVVRVEIQYAGWIYEVCKPREVHTESETGPNLLQPAAFGSGSKSNGEGVKSKTISVIVQALQGSNTALESDLLSKFDLESMQRMISTAIASKPKGTRKDGILTSLKHERSDWKDRKKKAEFPVRRLIQLAEQLVEVRDRHFEVELTAMEHMTKELQPQTFKIVDIFPQTAQKLEGPDARLTRVAPTDSEIAVKKTGVLKYFRYLRFLRQQAAHCIRKAWENGVDKVWYVKPIIRGFSMVPLPKYAPTFVRLDKEALWTVVRNSEALHEVQHSDSLLYDLLVVPTPPMEGMVARSILTDGATVIFCFTLRRLAGVSQTRNQPPPRFNENYNAFQLTRQERRALLKGMVEPLSVGVQSRPLNKWSGITSPASLRASLLQKLGLSTTDELLDCLPQHLKFAGLDPGVESPAYVIQDFDVKRNFRDYWMRRKQGNSQVEGKYVADNVSSAFLEEGVRYRLRNAVHQGLKGRVAASRKDVRWRKKTGADHVISAKAEVFRIFNAGGGIGCFSMAPSGILSVLAGLDRLPLRSVRQIMVAVQDESKDPISKVKHINLQHQGQPTTESIPMLEYRFGKRYKMARDNRRERFIRRRHVDVTARAIIGKRHRRRLMRMSRKARVRRIAQLNMSLCGRWNGRFAAKADRVALQKKHTEERRKVWRRLRKQEPLEEAVEAMQERHHQELESALTREHEELRERNRFFAQAKKLVPPQIVTPKRTQWCRLHKHGHTSSREDSKLTVLCLGDAIFRPCMKGHAPAGLVPMVAALSRIPGVLVVLVDEFRSSKLCFRCAGEMKRVGLVGSRKYWCPQCGLAPTSRHSQTEPSDSSTAATPLPPAATINRDRNGAANILLLGAREILWGERPRPWQRKKGEDGEDTAEV